ncbi:MAG TPA: hypothetical protein VHL80_04160, partial [Polyangia bacterium]|nr:hypothetical protein [Polyangia bacterium]
MRRASSRGAARLAALLGALSALSMGAAARAATAPLALAEAADGALDVRAGGAVVAHVPLDTPP